MAVLLCYLQVLMAVTAEAHHFVVAVLLTFH